MATRHLGATRRSLHGIAELVLAGPQYQTSGTIRLRVTPEGIATIVDPDLRLEGSRLVGRGRSVELAGTAAHLADAVGVRAAAPTGLYRDGSGVTPEEELHIDPAALRLIYGVFQRGHQVLNRWAPGQQVVLWPEHFDLAVAVDEGTFGISPGDAYIDEPYAYVSPSALSADPFWNMPFGAGCRLADLADDAAVEQFFERGRRLAVAARPEFPGDTTVA